MDEFQGWRVSVTLLLSLAVVDGDMLVSVSDFVVFFMSSFIMVRSVPVSIA